MHHLLHISKGSLQLLALLVCTGGCNAYTTVQLHQARAPARARPARPRRSPTRRAARRKKERKEGRKERPPAQVSGVPQDSPAAARLDALRDGAAEAAPAKAPAAKAAPVEAPAALSALEGQSELANLARLRGPKSPKKGGGELFAKLAAKTKKKAPPSRGSNAR